MVRMDVVTVGVVPGSSGIVLVLREWEGKRLLAMEIGPAEANAIAVAVEGVQVPRPLTHDLLAQILRQLEVKVSSVAVVNYDEQIFYGKVSLDTPKGSIEVDARPSDAIALALRQGAPIYAEDKVLLAAGVSSDEGHIVH